MQTRRHRFIHTSQNPTQFQYFRIWLMCLFTKMTLSEQVMKTLNTHLKQLTINLQQLFLSRKQIITSRCNRSKQVFANSSKSCATLVNCCRVAADIGGAASTGTPFTVGDAISGSWRNSLVNSNMRTANHS